MNRLDSAIASARTRLGSEEPRSIKKSEGTRLGKAIGNARRILSSKWDQSDKDFLQKGRHDALYHHIAHSKAAEKACYHKDAPPYSGGDRPEHEKRCKDAAQKHMFMFLRHALENVRDRDCYAMKSGMQRAINFYEDEAWAESNLRGEDDPYVLHFVNGGDFVPAPEDGDFLEDYEGGVPDVSQPTGA